jgi:hypothetical protein
MSEMKLSERLALSFKALKSSIDGSLWSYKCWKFCCPSVFLLRSKYKKYNFINTIILPPTILLPGASYIKITCFGKRSIQTRYFQLGTSCILDNASEQKHASDASAYQPVQAAAQPVRKAAPPVPVTAQSMQVTSQSEQEAPQPEQAAAQPEQPPAQLVQVTVQLLPVVAQPLQAETQPA